jgi:hypothetical protein
MLLDFGCDEAQGYYFSRPVQAADVSRLVGTVQHAQANSPNAANGAASWAENSSAIPPELKSLL